MEYLFKNTIWKRHTSLKLKIKINLKQKYNGELKMLCQDFCEMVKPPSQNSLEISPLCFENIFVIFTLNIYFIINKNKSTISPRCLKQTL